MSEWISGITNHMQQIIKNDRRVKWRNKEVFRFERSFFVLFQKQRTDTNER